MLDTSTKKRIDDCRDILVGKLPDPKAQIEQITIALIYKFMDDMDKEAIELGGQAKFFADYEVPDPEFPNDRSKDKIIEFSKYAWDNLLNPKVTATEMLTLYTDAIVGMDKNPNIPQLFRDIFKNAYLPYRDPETLKLFLKTIAGFEYSHSEKLGDAFEYLLQVMGSQGDAGQFRTPRHIIDFLVEVVDPSKTDTILDPACGTAGFLISAFKHIKEKNNNQLTPDERKKLIQNFVGYDISPDMVRLSLVNLYLHGFSDPHIFEYDTLSSEERWDESFDVILANPPFMSPKGGIRPHKKFTIQSKRSEVLFVDYIAEHLNPNGKAGIIVPEGIIFQSSTSYKDLRKLLVETSLWAVVSLPSGVFNPYSGVKTSILLLDKWLAQKTNKILFIKIENDGLDLGAQRRSIKGNELPEAISVIHRFKASLENGQVFKDSVLAHTVEKDEISENGDYNLSGERYRNVQDLSNVKYDIVELGDVLEFQYGKPLKKDDRIEGEYPVYGSNGIVGYHNEYLVEAPFLVIGRKGSAGAVHYSTKNGFPIDTTFFVKIENEEKIKLKYAYKILEFLELDKVNVQAGIPGLNRNDAYKLKIPLPPLSIQEEIVAEIEGYQKIIDGARMVVENYRPQIKIDPEWEMVELGEVCKLKGGNAFKSSDYVANGAELIRMGNVKSMKFDPENSPKYLPIEYMEDYKRFVLKEGDILISMTGTVGKEDYGNVCVVDRKGNYLLNQRVGKFEILNEEILNPKFLYYCANQTWFRKMLFSKSSGGVRQANISSKGVESVKIPLIPIQDQLEIVKTIDSELNIVNANERLIGIFEQRIKDRISEIWGTNKNEA